MKFHIHKYAYCTKSVNLYRYRKCIICYKLQMYDDFMGEYINID